jgi:carbonic anhydrase
MCVLPSGSMDSFKRLLDYNERWVADRLELDPEYFSRLEDDQRPEYVWIGSPIHRYDFNGGP